MYTVKKLVQGTTYRKIGPVEWIAGRNAWAVLDANGNVAQFKNTLSGKMNDEIYNTKRTAQMEADFLNAKG